MTPPQDPRALLLWNLFEPLDDDPARVREDLEDLGYDAQALDRAAEAEFARLKGQLLLETEAAQTDRIHAQAERLRAQLRRALEVEQDPNAALLAQLNRRGAPQAFFRKLEELGPEEALQMLDDFEVLRLLGEAGDEPGDEA